MACEIPAGQDYVVKTVNFVATRKTSNLAETFFLQYTGAALHQRYSGLHEPWGVCWSRQVVKSCPFSLQEFCHRQFSIMGSSRFFSNRKSLTDKKILWRTCIVPRDVNDWDGETSIKVNIWLFSEACPRIKRIHLTRWLRRLTFGLLAFFSFRSSSKALFPSLRFDHIAGWQPFFFRLNDVLAAASILLLKVPGGQLGKIFAFASLNHPVQLPSTEGLDPTLLDTIRS